MIPRNKCGVSLLELLLSLAIGLPLLAILVRETSSLIRVTKNLESSLALRAARTRIQLELEAAAARIDALALPGIFRVHVTGALRLTSGAALLQRASETTNPGSFRALSYVRAYRTPLLRSTACSGQGPRITGRAELLGGLSSNASIVRSALALRGDSILEGRFSMHGLGNNRAFVFEPCDGIFFPQKEADCTVGYFVLLDSSITIYTSAEGNVRLISSSCEEVLENQPLTERSTVTFSRTIGQYGEDMLRAVVGSPDRENTVEYHKRLSLPRERIIDFVSHLP